MPPPKFSKAHNAKNNEFDRLSRQKRVAKMYCEGKSQFEIAKEVGVVQPTVAKDLEVIRKAWLATAILDWDEAKSKELAKIDNLEERMWEAYWRSAEIERIKITTVHRELRIKTEGRGENRQIIEEKMVPTADTKQIKERQLIGDPRFIERIQWCIETRCKLLGLLDTEKQQVNVQIINWEQVANVRSESDSIEDRLKQLENVPSIEDVPNIQEVITAPNELDETIIGGSPQPSHDPEEVIADEHMDSIDE